MTIPIAALFYITGYYLYLIVQERMAWHHLAKANKQKLKYVKNGCL